MSEQDEILTIGLIAKELSDARKRCATATTFLESFAHKLDTISRLCRDPGHRSLLAIALGEATTLGRSEAFASVEQAIRELAEQLEQLQRIEKRAREVGLSL